MSKDETQEKIDAALDAALDDLDDDDDDEEQQQRSSPPRTTPNRPVLGPVPPPQINADDMGMAGIDDMMKQLMQGGLGPDDEGGQADEFLGRLLQEMQSQIGDELKNVEQSSPNKKSSPQKASPKKAQQPSQPSPSAAAGESDVDQAIASLVDGMAQQAKLDEPNIGAMDGPGSEDELLKTMMGQLGEGFGGEDGGVNPDALIDGMMEQLLAKDLMYEPIKKVAEKFPDWLEQNKGKISEDEYEQRCKQFKCFQNLVNKYDAEPENVQSLMLLMQEVQEFGQPPPEIIQDIAPGLELDADGLPKMDGNAAMPFGGDEECRVM